MAKAALKEKSKPATARPAFDKPSANQIPSDDDVDMDETSDDESIPEKDETEKKLERMLFGDDEGFMGALKAQQQRADGMQLDLHTERESEGEEDAEDDENLEELADEDLFFLDSGTAAASTDIIPAPETPSDDDEEEEQVPAIWHDSDDEKLAVSLAGKARLRKLRVAESEDVISGKEYIRRLRRQFQSLHPTPDWANPEAIANHRNAGSDAEDADFDEENDQLSVQPLAKLLQSSAEITSIEENAWSAGKRKLRQEVLDIQRLKDVGKAQPVNPCGRPRRYFHIWDMDTGKVDKVKGTADRKEEQKTMERLKPSPCGRYIGLVGSSRKGGGLINILDSNTAQWIAQVRVDGRGGVADFAWWSDGEGMTIASKNGEVTEWDGRLRRVVARWMDAGAVGTTVLGLGGRSGRTQLGGDRWVAVGSSSGVVNVYDRRDWAAAYAASADGAQAIPRNPTPTRALEQLTTPTSHLVFSPDGQMLVMASRWKRDALRLVHLPSCTVYRNWPTANTPLGRISAVAISPNSEQLAVANEQGRIRLWEIRG
ncbi:hypothetical protein N7468_010507 [Penicillium chermesinum]|uniref:Uncharacterized protein n=1 Tax=Penicillium chermesinum TaxID=63820 RepID=A0A9W9N7V1_9EURO|nr:uncharacterized protein N7468_010507 [Penicillium chermesinum]KAJ5214828.1 hypothetical protein N7468_010507 [Penicillium chermesinum]